MTAPSKEELRVRLAELERHYSLAHLAVKILGLAGLGVSRRRKAA